MDYNEIFKEEYNMLNEAQKQAVESIYGPVMVVAWPGTGKTQIIGLRTANIINLTWTNPENILITTFTEAWVIAIRKRLLKFLGHDAYKVTVSTIHSFAQDVIKTFPEKFMEYKAWTAIDDVEQLEVVKNILDELIEDKKIETLTTDYDKYFYLYDIKSRISNLKQEWISLWWLKLSIEKQREAYSEELAEIKPTLKKYETTKASQEKHILKLEELVIIFEAYNAYLRKESKYDFNDMINFALDKFRDDEELRLYYAEKFHFIMLDEYQDTNNAQNQIINYILSVNTEAKNIMVVWDDDQSIYRFQGANIENMLEFSSSYTDTKIVVLENNYRSNQAILDVASQLIDNNEERLSKKIETINKHLISSGKYKNSGLRPTLYKATSDIDEKAFVLEKLKESIENDIALDEIAIIVRNNREVEQWTKLLYQNHIEVESKLKTDILKSHYIDFTLKYLKLINNPFLNETDLIDIMRTKVSGLNQIDVLKLNRYLYRQNYTKKFKLGIFDILSEPEKLEELELSNLDSLLEFRDMILSMWEKYREVSFLEFFNHFLRETGLLDYIEVNWSFDDIEDIFTLFNKIKDWNKNDSEFSIDKLAAKISLYKAYNYPIPRQILKKAKAWVQVLTAHSSKGLEYEVVFIPWLYTWNWEWKKIPDKLKLPIWIAWAWLQAEVNPMEEDRRLFFVALTRAKNELYMSYPAWIGTKPLLQSVFIEEISGAYDDLELDIDRENFDIETIVTNELRNELEDYDEGEFEYIKEFLETYKISPSDLNIFLEDPKEFLRRTEFKYPFMDNIFTIFGKVYHKTLEEFYLYYKQEWKLPNKEFLTNRFKSLLNYEVVTPEEKEKLLEKWVAWLEGYYDLYSSSSREPLMLEYSFRHRNIVWENIPLTGTIDKIEKISQKKVNPEEAWMWQLAFFKESVALIDYKTWSAKTIGQIKWTDRYGNKKPWEWKYFRQLLFYKLLCENDREFSSTLDIWSLAIDFVEGKDWNYKYIEVDYSPEDYEEFKADLKEAWEKINDIEFWRKVLNK